MKRGKQPCTVRKVRPRRKGSNELKWGRKKGGPKQDSLTTKKKRLHNKSAHSPQPADAVKEAAVEKDREICGEGEMDSIKMGGNGVESGRVKRDAVRQVKRPLRRKPKIFFLRTAVCRRTLLSYTRTASESEVPPAPATPSQGPNQTDDFSKVYITGDILGKGGCGSVYSGLRKSDGTQVAIKYVKKYRCEPYLKLPAEKQALPLEVALMHLVSQPPSSPYVLQLLDWFEEPENFILVLERPYPCMDLFDFIDELGGRLDECLARVVMLQVAHAVLHCCERGVLHRDIKLENLLVQTDSLRVKLIVFGCGDLLRDTMYRDFAGTDEYCPPEWLLDGRYSGRPATIWSLGILLFSMVCGDLPFNKRSEIIAGQLKFKKGLSEECKHLIGWCLHPDPTRRPVLQQVLLHEWMMGWQTPLQ
ncbi:serine/threonine-protein kinase pim-3-like [Alosa sapidissima]|uniref:serine/threonine-protein kinase pim-3-like n=1 Tax=Alosa sapidissima TaxID=34773 RepID=UPI001C09E377|nr:serine/threonine-protein kinase pim-3-like [Alosa sapidissima]